MGESTINRMNLTVYTKKGCWWCEDLLAFLQTKKVKYEEKEVLSSVAYYEEMIGLSGQKKAPTVVINGIVYADTDKDIIGKILNIN